MGQYYHPVLLDADSNVIKSMYSHEFDSGLKLMEHSWLNNKFVQVFESLLVMDGPVRVVWAGDYADPELDAQGNPRKRVEEGQEYDLNLYGLATEDTWYRPDTPAYGRKANYNWYYANGRRRDKPVITYGQDRKAPPNAPAPAVLPTTTSHPWLLNHDKGLAVDKRKVPKDSEGWRIHPLPLLTMEGNGRGGGDFHGDDKLIGSWARDRISLASRRPKGFTVIPFDLVEA